MVLSKEQWVKIERVAEHYAQFHDTPRQMLSAQLHQLTSELGEVADAFIGCTGANRRKGFTHTDEDLANELGDLAMTAVMTLFFCADDPELVIDDTLRKFIARLEKEEADNVENSTVSQL